MWKSLGEEGRDEEVFEESSEFMDLNSQDNFKTLAPELYEIKKRTAICRQLKQRVVSVGGLIQLAGQDKRRRASRKNGELIDSWHFVDRAAQCAHTPCASLCTARFTYAKGCGRDTPAANNYVKAPPVLRKLSTLRASDHQSAWTARTQGV